MVFAISAFDLNQRPDATRVVLCEGASEVGLAEAYLKALQADPHDVAVMCFRGITNINAKITTMAKLLGPGRDKLEHLAGLEFWRITKPIRRAE